MAKTLWDEIGRLAECKGQIGGKPHAFSAALSISKILVPTMSFGRHPQIDSRAFLSFFLLKCKERSDLYISLTTTPVWNMYCEKKFTIYFYFTSSYKEYGF